MFWAHKSNIQGMKNEGSTFIKKWNPLMYYSFLGRESSEKLLYGAIKVRVKRPLYVLMWRVTVCCNWLAVSGMLA